MPETTENYHRIPVSEGHEGHRIRTIDIGKGIRALYCGTCKKIKTYLFPVGKFSMAEARQWVASNKAQITEVAGVMYSVKIVDEGVDEMDDEEQFDEEMKAELIGEFDLWNADHQWVGEIDDEQKAKLSYGARKRLKEEDFAWVEAGPGCEKKDGKRPQRCLHLPIHDCAHVRNARARIPQMSGVPDSAKRKVAAAMERCAAKAMNAVKAIEQDGQWIIEGWGAPYGGPVDGKDEQGEYFDAKTDFGLDYYPSRPIVFHHGLTEKEPIVIGREMSYERRDGGVWIRAVLDKTKELAKKAWELARAGKLFWSSGAVSHLVRKAGGYISKWPVAEWSATPNPVNRYATVTVPMAKARFKAIGIEFDDGATSDGDGESPEERFDEEPTAAEQKTHEEVKEMSEEIKAAVAEAMAELEKAKRAEAEAKELEELREELPKLREELDKIKAGETRKEIFDDKEGEETVEVLGNFWDQQEAADREMVAMMLQGAGKPLSDNLRNAVKGGLDEALKADPGWLRWDEDGEKVYAAQVKAISLMDRTDTANWRPANYERRIWDRLRLENRAAAQFTQMDLPTDNYYLPTATAGPTVYVVPEQTAGTPTLSTGITTSQITDAKVTFATTKLGCAVWFSGELDEDAIMPQLPIVRDQIGKAMDEGIENGILNGDKTTGTKNISEATAATTSKNIVCDGMRHFGLVDATTFKRDCGALDIDDAIAIRQLMAKYGIRPSDLVWFCDYNTIYKVLGWDELVTLDKYGPNAVVSAGEVGQLLGSPLIVSGEMNKYGTDGKYHATPTTGVLICVHKPSWIVGWRRRIKFGVNYYDHVDSTRVTSLLRMDLQKFGTSLGHASVGYNITLT